MHDQDNRRSTYEGLLTKSRDPLEFKADTANGILSGHTTKWWVVDSYAETTAPGSSIPSSGACVPSRTILFSVCPL